MGNLCRDAQVQLYEQIVTNMSSGLYIFSIGNGTIFYANSKFERLFDYNHNELLGLQGYILNAATHKTTVQTTEVMMNSLESTGEWHGEVFNVKKDGTIFWCQVDFSTFNHSTYGKVGVAIHSDITDSITIRQKLKKTQLLLKSSIESPKDLIIVSIDNDFRYLYFNESHHAGMKTIYGVDVKVGMNFSDCIIDEEDRKFSKNCFDIALAGNAYSRIAEFGIAPERFFMKRNTILFVMVIMKLLAQQHLPRRLQKGKGWK